MKSNGNVQVMTEKLHVCTSGLLFISKLQAQILINHCIFTTAALLIPKWIALPEENIIFYAMVMCLCLKADQEVSCQTSGSEGEGFVSFICVSGKLPAGLKLISSFVFILIKSSHLNTKTSCSLFTTVYSKTKYSDSPF